jgi:hypothetical protein
MSAVLNSLAICFEEPFSDALALKVLAAILIALDHGKINTRKEKDEGRWNWYLKLYKVKPVKFQKKRSASVYVGKVTICCTEMCYLYSEA